MAGPQRGDTQDVPIFFEGNIVPDLRGEIEFLQNQFAPEGTWVLSIVHQMDLHDYIVDAIHRQYGIDSELLTVINVAENGIVYGIRQINNGAGGAGGAAGNGAGGAGGAAGNGENSNVNMINIENRRNRVKGGKRNIRKTKKSKKHLRKRKTSRK
jgi:hypothetical protein